MNLLRIESLFWGYSLRFRRVLRGLRAWLSDAKHALATALGRAPATRIRSLPPRSRRSDSPSGEFDLIVDGDPEDIPQVAAEALRLVAAAEGSAVVVAGAGRPVPGRSGRPVPGRSTVPVHAFRGRSTLKLLQDRPHTGSLAALGKSIPILHGDQEPRHPLPSFPFDMVDGYWLPPGQGVGRRLRRRLSDPYAGLGSLPVLQGPPTVLFLLPFLAVGGAERLLFDLLEDLVTRYRCLVVTVEPHRHELGSTVHRGAWLTPHVFTLGDWLPREAHFGAVSHLIRRFDVRHLVSWNGTIFFFDFVAALGRRFPGLGISSQLYHFKGGWTARTSPAVIRSVQTHIAVNNPIRDALVHRLAIPDDNVRVIHHGVPKAPERDEHRARALRDELRNPCPSRGRRHVHSPACAKASAGYFWPSLVDSAPMICGSYSWEVVPWTGPSMASSTMLLSRTWSVCPCRQTPCPITTSWTCA